MQNLGILRASGHEHFTGSVVIPVINDGIVREVYGRKVRDDLRAGTPVHLYLPGPHRGVFNVEALAAGEVIVCESLVDALTLWCAGYRNVTAAYGVEGFTVEHRAAFEAHGVRRVVIAYDRDDAGDRAARALADELVATGVECFRVELPHGTDINDVARAAGSPTDALGAVLRAAVWMGGSPGPTSRVSVED
ncbi:MAG: toprim domain-containing protein, partial [Acidimicrobiales bacterium]